MLSAIVCSLLNTLDKKELIQKCTGSLTGYDELIVLTTTVGGLGYCAAWNMAAEMAHGDYLCFISDDHIVSDSLKGMCIEGTVTSPMGTGTGQGVFWGGMFCVPRDIYEKYGLYDMEYDKGIHYMDEDLFERYKKENVPMSRVNVRVVHENPGHTLNRVEDFNTKTSLNHDIFDRKWRRSAQ